MSRPTVNWLFYTPFIVAYLTFVSPSFSGGTVLADRLVDLLGLMIILAGLVIRIVSREWKVSEQNIMKASMGVERLPASGKIPPGLVSTGPYSVVRNPMYIGSLLLGLGVCVIIGNVPFLAAFGVGYIVIHDLIVRSEERFLLGCLGDQYAAYLKSVPRWIPPPGAFVRYLRTKKPLPSLRIAIVREMNTIFGALIGVAVLESYEHLKLQGWQETRTLVTSLLSFSAVVLLAWIVCSIKPVKARLKRRTAY